MIRSPLFLLITSIICVLVGLYIQSSYIEIFASVMGIINVWLLAREKVSNFLFGMITVAVFLYIFITQGLYAMAVLAAFQFIFNVYGWYHWIARSGEEEVKATVRLDLKGWIFLYNLYFSCMDWLGVLSSPLLRINKSIFRRFKCCTRISSSIYVKSKNLRKLAFMDFI